jgi:hypothetical protein
VSADWRTRRASIDLEGLVIRRAAQAIAQQCQRLRSLPGLNTDSVHKFVALGNPGYGGEWLLRDAGRVVLSDEIFPLLLWSPDAKRLAYQRRSLLCTTEMRV